MERLTGRHFISKIVQKDGVKSKPLRTCPVCNFPTGKRKKAADGRKVVLILAFVCEIGRDIIYDRGQDGGLVDDIIQESDEKKKCIKIKVSIKDERESTSSSQRNIQDEIGDRDDNGDQDPGYEDFKLREGQCPYCFTCPCVAAANITAPWIGKGQPPSNANPQIRKGIYRRIWKCINNMYGWLLPQYLDKRKDLVVANGLLCTSVNSCL
ncbi:unnamed protein product [Mytilus edulis]|uniref:Uncharacterized protein n=1 Tax=Mytilus edulis TaxID=6550 RepID=A0A8S3PTN6_MYTED|nr:unnamed protein product [Mytilus edulis]